MRKPGASEGEIEEALQGNLCRCTGYQPIVAAARAAGRASPAGDPLVAERAAIRARLDALDDGARVDIRVGDDRLVVPPTVDDLARVLVETPQATIVAGMTDVGLWITKFMRSISPAVFVAHLEELRRIDVGPEGVTIGAGVSYDDFQATLDAEFPHLSDYWRRIGGWQVRAMGTVGGNVANGSPIGDCPPALIALGATVTLRKGEARRTLPLENFFIAYGKQDREPGEFVESIFVPKPSAGTLNAAYKVTKRRDEDISAVACGFHVALKDGTVEVARLAFGGMAATPKRAAAVEAALVGKPWTLETVARAEAAFAQDFQPITDWRASADYRATVARNLLRRFYLESTGEPVRLQREVAV
jgi:xanthine dehydrogenase small subunit